MKKLVFAMLAVLGMSLTSCFGDKPVTQKGEQDSTSQVNCELEAAPEANAEDGAADVTEEKKEAPADDKAAPAENAENAEKK